jgi:membrane protein implicated in regulation of membrane protease activity
MEILGFNPTLFWFVLGLVFLALEAATPGFFLIFFGIGAWAVSLLLLALNIPPGLQLAIFMAVSVFSLMALRRKLKSLFQGRLAKNDNMDDPVFSGRFIGREVLVLEEVGRDAGLAELNGVNWQARTEGPVLAAGARGLVRRIDGLTLIITPKEKI